MSDELLLHTEGDVLVLTLNRPHRRNAISMALARAMRVSTPISMNVSVMAGSTRKEAAARQSCENGT